MPVLIVCSVFSLNKVSLNQLLYTMVFYLSIFRYRPIIFAGSNVPTTKNPTEARSLNPPFVTGFDIGQSTQYTTESHGFRRTCHVCNLCSKSFRTVWHLKRHSLSHTGERPYTCDICGQTFRQKPHLLSHYRKHIYTSEIPFSNN